MMFTNKKCFFNVFIMVVLVMFMVGCSKHYETESGKDLGSKFTAVYNVMTMSNSFYFQSKKVIKRAWEQDKIDSDTKEKLVPYINNYKDAHNAAQVAVDNWYNAIENNEPVDTRFVVQQVLTMIDKAKVVSKVSSELTDGQLQLPDNLLPTVADTVMAFVDTIESKEDKEVK